MHSVIVSMWTASFRQDARQFGCLCGTGTSKKKRFIVVSGSLTSSVLYCAGSALGTPAASLAVVPHPPRRARTVQNVDTRNHHSPRGVPTGFPRPRPRRPCRRSHHRLLRLNLRRRTAAISSSSSFPPPPDSPSSSSSTSSLPLLSSPALRLWTLLARFGTGLLVRSADPGSW